MKKLFLSIFPLLFFCLYSQAQTTAIPDPNFETQLIQMGIDSDGLVNGQILNSDAAGVTLLSFPMFSNISNLTGIAAFSSLTHLECSGNQLTSLDLSSNPNLILLSCSFNQLTSLDLSNNPNLEELYCSNNQLINLNILSNPNLENLYCTDNQLINLNTSNNPNLNDLSCSNNQLTNLSPSNHPNLISLNCSNNQLTSLDLSNNPNLEELDCPNNQLTSLDLSNNPSLTRIYCYSNQLTNIDVSNHPNLEYLACANTQLTSLDLSSNPSLKYLACANNQLNSLDLSNNSNLEDLYCTNTQLTSLDLSSNPSLKYLACANNQLNSLDLSSNPLIGTIYCYANQLIHLNLSNNPNLEYVNCFANQLTNLDLSSSPNLEYLVCNTNQLASLDLSSNPSLTSLYTNNNTLTSLDLSSNPNLEYLVCSNNQLTNLNLSNNPSLTTLYCNHNTLTSLDLSSNPNLDDLDCHFNQLTNLNLSNNLSLTTLHCNYNRLTSLDLSSSPILSELNIQNNFLSYINTKNSSLSSLEAVNNLPYLLICVNDSSAVSINTNWSKDPTATYTEICPNTTLVGSMKSDLNNNCQLDSLEPIISNAIIQISSATDTIYKTSNSFGNYSSELDSGTYTLSITPQNPYLAPCINPQSVSIDSINDLDTVNWAVQTTHYCPYLHASISAPFLRMTGGGSYYTVSYCNNGTAPAYGAYIEVILDSFLNVQGAGLPVLSQVGNVYTFNLDTIDIGECGNFNINVIVDTSAQIGQLHCSEVHIYPDSLCNNTWTGPIIEAEGICANDTIIFKLKNIGGSMLSPRNYLVIEDNLVMFTNPFTLGSGISTTIYVAAQPGKTYRIEAQQAVGYPATLGSNIAYANVQNCHGTSTNPNAALQFYNGNTAPWIDIDCQTSIAAYDPNDKAAQQIGYGSQNYIERGTPLDYKVRFQNTGNDTAFHITILDTISTHLDLSTLQMKAASHNYTWQIVNGNTLRVDFPNIKLVDSIANEPLSHGFFRYEIQQKPNLPLETAINNQAAIYFDYNPPIFTNTTLHTIGENYIPIILSMQQTWVEEMQVHLYPNPTSGLIYLEQSKEQKIQIKVFDNLGRIVFQQNAKDKQTSLDLNKLPQGIYYINIQQDKKVSTHKVIKY